MDVFSWTSDVHLRKLSEHTCKMQDGVFNMQCMDFKILNKSKEGHKAPKTDLNTWTLWMDLSS